MFGQLKLINTSKLYTGIYYMSHSIILRVSKRSVLLFAFAYAFAIANAQHSGHGHHAEPSKPTPRRAVRQKRPTPPRTKKRANETKATEPQHEHEAQPETIPQPHTQSESPPPPIEKRDEIIEKLRNGLQINPPTGGLPEPVVSSGPVMRLEELEQMALKNSPTIAQSEAAIRVAEGRRRQAGLLPNPVIGYFGEELNFRGVEQRSEHGLFVEQTLPLGGKLAKDKQVFAHEKAQAESQAELQRQRVRNSVRLLFYETLGAQYLVTLRNELARLSNEAVTITRELYNLGQADLPDLLEAEIEAQRAENEKIRAETDLVAVWQMLAAQVGNLSLTRAKLEGNLEEFISAINHEQLLSDLLSTGPEIKAARIGVERAKAVLARERAARIPDLYLRGGLGYNNELMEIDNRKAGLEGSVEVGVTLPIFNRNQGGIAAAEAELAIAEREIQRIELLTRSRFSSAMQQYRNSVQVAEKYRDHIVPTARRAYEMYLSNFKQMAASYPQVLIAQRTLFQVQVEYARALLDIRRYMVGLRGSLITGSGLERVGREEQFNNEQ
jgi:outer membrane protein, heavy metal efflux system